MKEGRAGQGPSRVMPRHQRRSFTGHGPPVPAGGVLAPARAPGSLNVEVAQASVGSPLGVSSELSASGGPAGTGKPFQRGNSSLV